MVQRPGWKRKEQLGCCSIFDWVLAVELESCLGGRGTQGLLSVCGGYGGARNGERLPGCGILMLFMEIGSLEKEYWVWWEWGAGGSFCFWSVKMWIPSSHCGGQGPRSGSANTN